MNEASLPGMYRIRQQLKGEDITALTDEIKKALEVSLLSERILPGMKIAVTAGSRGIDRIVEVLEATINWLTYQGASPFIIPAMGSHGGCTPIGRKQVLAELGINEDRLGVPIESNPDTVILGHVDGLPVHCLKAAAQSDGIVLMNRIKPHTSFSGKYESGLTKMLVVGLGLEHNARSVHSLGVKGLSKLLPKMAGLMFKQIPILFGMALLENGYDRLIKVEVIAAENIMKQEPKYLEEARLLQPMLPFEEADLLIVDYLGKDFSGTGMDTNVIGRLHISNEQEPEHPRIKRIAVLRLSPASKGNAYGIGLADLTTEAVAQAMDTKSTYANAMTSTFIERARLPMTLSSDKETILAAIATCNHLDTTTLKLARINNTLHLSELLVSKPFLPFLKRAEIIEGPLDWEFDHQGNLNLH